jgi:predicted AlkP superfamily phosphohydrolase/phosphomutase/tetratricopeptide (TPR) repeat protein
MGSCCPKVVVIGWHGANWKSLHPLVDAGLMPNLRSLIERGAAGNLKTIGPSDPALLWTSVATGKTADQHGILSALECDPMSGRLRSTHGAHRKTKAVWNIAMQSGLIAHVAGWYAATPAEELNGSSVTSEFVVPTAPASAPWPLPQGAIYPDPLAEIAAGLRLHPAEFRIQDLAPLIPSIAAIDAKQDLRIAALSDILAREISMHAIATLLMEQRPWNLFMIGWHALGRACQRFMEYADPRMPHVSEDDFAKYSEVVNGVYRFSDMLLGRLIELAGEEANVVIVSPAAFRVGGERPVSPVVQRMPAAWYKPQGILCMSGPNIVEDELIHGATLLDIAPTILAMLGLEPGSDMPGQVLTKAFVKPPGLVRIPSWDKTPGACGMLRSETEADEQAAAAAIAQLLEEGYTETARPTETEAAVHRARSMNAVLVHLAARRYDDARPILTQLDAEAPDEPRTRLWLAHCHLLCGDRAACRDVLQGTSRAGAAGDVASLMEAWLAMIEGDLVEAQSAVKRAGPALAGIPAANYAAAIIYLRLSAWDQGEKFLRRAIALDPSYQPAHHLLARLLTHRGDSEQAAEFARSALEIDYASAFSHVALGLAMLGSGDGEQALHAFENSLALDPNLEPARSWADTLREQRSRSADSLHNQPNS